MRSVQPKATYSRVLDALLDCANKHSLPFLGLSPFLLFTSLRLLTLPRFLASLTLGRFAGSIFLSLPSPFRRFGLAPLPIFLPLAPFSFSIPLTLLLLLQHQCIPTRNVSRWTFLPGQGFHPALPRHGHKKIEVSLAVRP